jgi:hypothetical protein
VLRFRRQVTTAWNCVDSGPPAGTGPPRVWGSASGTRPATGRRVVVIERIKARGGPMEHIQYVPVIYSFLDTMSKDGWIVLDSSEWTIEQTVNEVLSRIAPVSGDVQG